MNSKFLCRALSKILPEKCGRIYDLLALQQHFGGGMQGLVEAVSDIIDIDSVDWPHPLESWKDFLLLMQVQVRKRSSLKLENVENDDFGRCEFCWRFVALREVTGQGRFFCHLHQRNSAEYRKIKKLEQIAHQLQELMDWDREKDGSPWSYLKGKARRLFAAVRTQWVIDRSNLPEDFVGLYGHNILELQQRIEETVTYPFTLLQSHFPTVVRYVRELGYDPESPLSLLQALNPEPPMSDSESDDSRQKHRALLSAFSKNLALYRLELCEAELILRAYTQCRELKNS